MHTFYHKHSLQSYQEKLSYNGFLVGLMHYD